MKFLRGDRVRQGPDGPLMEVLAASERLAICTWEIDGTWHNEVFETKSLARIAVQQQQQPQAGDGDA